LAELVGGGERKKTAIHDDLLSSDEMDTLAEVDDVRFDDDFDSEE
jgi:hypothetical protein